MNTVTEQAKVNFLLAEEFQDFKEYIGYKFDLNKEEFEAIYEEFVKWSSSEIETKDIKVL